MTVLIDSIAVEAARIKHRLKWGLVDSIVYATARRKAASVLTGDGDFQGQDDVIFLKRT